MLKTDRYNSLFDYYADVFNIDGKLLKAQAIAESGLNPDVQSPVGAQGLTQFMPTTFADFSKALRHASIWNPEHAIRVQAQYMSILIFECKTIELALAAYNWGIGHVRRTFLDKGLPYDPSRVPKETAAYVHRIMEERAA